MSFIRLSFWFGNENRIDPYPIVIWKKINNRMSRPSGYHLKKNNKRMTCLSGCQFFFKWQPDGMSSDSHFQIKMITWWNPSGFHSPNPKINPFTIKNVPNPKSRRDHHKFLSQSPLSPWHCLSWNNNGVTMNMKSYETWSPYLKSHLGFGTFLTVNRLIFRFELWEPDEFHSVIILIWKWEPDRPPSDCHLKKN